MKLIGYLLAAAVLAAMNVQADLNVVPAVQSWAPEPGVFSVKRARIIVDDKFAPELDGVAADFKAELMELGCGKFPITHGVAGNKGMCLTLAATNSLPGGPEAYRIDINDRVNLTANSRAGIFYGTRTLLQLLAQDKTNLSLPRGTIVDYPKYPRRMLMLDVGRKPFPMPVLKDYLRMLSWYKMNELHLHLSDEAFGGLYSGFRVESDAFPGLASKDLFYTKRELREFQDLAHSLGITVTPEIDMPGHARCFTSYWPDLCLKGHPTYLDVMNPQTIAHLEKLLDEMIPIFDAPDFHIGTDEYSLDGMSAADQEKYGEAFRQFINTMNAYIRSKGKNCRIWSGYEYMPGTTLPDPSVTIDMWVTHDAKTLIDQGHKVINSSDGQTYIVPGAHYYGVNNGGIFNNWEPWKISGDADKNPSPDDPHLLGGKLHVWNDQGPTGYDMTEIAALALPSIQVFAEKLWGKKGSQNYSEFQKRVALTQPVPGVTVLERIPAKNAEGVVLDLPGEVALGATNDRVKLPFAGWVRADLEWPWTLTIQVCKTAETGVRGVILSSDSAEICSDYSRSEEQNSKDAAGKESKVKVVRHGFGVLRAAGSLGEDAASARLANDVSRVYGKALPLNRWVNVAVVGNRGQTVVYINGVEAGESNNQMVCPLAWLGSRTGNSFVGKVRGLKVYNHLLSTGELASTATDAAE